MPSPNDEDRSAHFAMRIEWLRRETHAKTVGICFLLAGGLVAACSSPTGTEVSPSQGTDAFAFTFPKPILRSAPQSAAPGTEISVVGENFNPKGAFLGPYVVFDAGEGINTFKQSARVISNQEIRTIVPPGHGPVNLRVETVGGSTQTLPFEYKIPHIESTTPASGWVGDQIQITGEGFGVRDATVGSYVLIGTSLVHADSWADNSIQLTAPRDVGSGLSTDIGISLAGCLAGEIGDIPFVAMFLPGCDHLVIDLIELYGLRRTDANIEKVVDVVVHTKSGDSNAGSYTFRIATKVISISVSPSTVSLEAGRGQQMTANVSGTSNTAVRWSSSAPSVATVTSTGFVTAIAAGSATITATSQADPTRTATAAVSVSPATPTNCSASNAAASLASETYSDNTQVTGGTNFTKTWTLRNNGSCTWPTNFTFRYVSNTAGLLSVSQSNVGFGSSVPPGGTITFSLPMRAPAAKSTNATYREDWRLTDSNGATTAVSGSSTIWMQIVVPSSPSTSNCTASNAIATFVSETYPDNIKLSRGTSFTKQWTIRNGGNCTWPTTFSFRYLSSTAARLSLSQEAIFIGTAVLPGQTLTLSIPMRAPMTVGTFREDWRFVDGNLWTMSVGGAPSIWVKDRGAVTSSALSCASALHG